VIAAVGRDRAVRAAGLDHSLPGHVGAGAESIAELVRTRLGPLLLDQLVRPIINAIHGGQPEQLTIDRVAPELPRALVSHGSLTAAVAHLVPPGPAVRSPVGGMAGLIDAMADDAVRRGARIESGRRVTAVRRQGRSWQVTTPE